MSGTGTNAGDGGATRRLTRKLDQVHVQRRRLRHGTHYRMLTEVVSEADKARRMLDADVAAKRRRASFVAFYCRGERRDWIADHFPKRAGAVGTVLMQLRFDGSIGFVGGLVEDGENDKVSALRECEEEFNCRAMLERKFGGGGAGDGAGDGGGGVDGGAAALEERILAGMEFVSMCMMRSMTVTLYAMELTAAEVRRLEVEASGAEHWGTETFGVVRVPLFLMFRGGFDTFLGNQFPVSAREQLVHLLSKLGLVTDAWLLEAIRRAGSCGWLRRFVCSHADSIVASSGSSNGSGAPNAAAPMLVDPA